MAKIAFLTSPEAFWGSEEAGLFTHYIDQPSRLPEVVRELLSQDFSLIVVSEELVAGKEGEIRYVMEKAPPDASLILVPAPGSSKLEGLQELRDRFSSALGVDVWKVTAEKVGVDI